MKTSENPVDELIVDNAIRIDTAGTPSEKLIGLARIKFFEPDSFMLLQTIIHIVTVEQLETELPPPKATENKAMTDHIGNAMDEFGFLLSAIEQLGYIRKYLKIIKDTSVEIRRRTTTSGLPRAAASYKFDNVDCEYAPHIVEKYLARFLRALVYSNIISESKITEKLMTNSLTYNKTRRNVTRSSANCSKYHTAMLPATIDRLKYTDDLKSSLSVTSTGFRTATTSVKELDAAKNAAEKMTNLPLRTVAIKYAPPTRRRKLRRQRKTRRRQRKN